MFINDQILISVCSNVKVAMSAVFAKIRAKPILINCLKGSVVLRVWCIRVNHVTTEIDTHLVPIYDVI